MPLRTPRRRISPRTKRRYRAIKAFVRRALGTSSQAGTKTSSSIEVSVSDLKSKITDIKQQLNKVSKHCRDLTCLEHSFRKESQNSLAQSQRDHGSINQQETCDTDANEVETKLLYNSSDSQHRKPDEKPKTVNDTRHDDTTDMASANQRVAQNIQDFRFNQKNSGFRTKRREDHDIDLLDRGRTRSKYKTIGPIYSTSSFHSLVEPGNKHYSKPGCSSHRHEKRPTRKEYTEPFVLKQQRDRETVKKLLRNHERGFDDRYKTKRTKRVYSEVDKDFIADIIKRQYRPVKLFGRRDSDFSQFSAPVCRDQEFTVRNEIQEGIELCSCCFDDCRRKRHSYVRHTDLSDMRSICDTRLYSSKKHRRHTLEKNCIDDYNNSALYDVVPVREKSSPKARRKFTEDNTIAYQYLREVPPSPRSHRPRLNLKVQQYTDYEDCLCKGRHQSRRNSPTREVRKKVTNAVESDVSSICYHQRAQAEILNSAKCQKSAPIHEDVGTMSSLQYPNFANEQVNLANNDTTLNTQLTDSSVDKTDKTLCEIKDILRTFLLEIKKESTGSNSSDGTSKIENKQLTQHQGTKTNSNIIPNSGHSFNYGVGQCGVSPFMPAFPNPCCYPILPMCPMNCMQNGYIIPSPSYTCAVCAKTSKEHGCLDKDSPHDHKSEEVNTNNETQELIKEIYKFVSQKPKSPRTTEGCGNEDHSARSKNDRLFDRKETSRYVGGSSKASKHDANVGTPHLKYYSKSCEAIGSRIASDTYNTNASYSDTILEKLSLEATHSSTETDISTDVPGEKVKRTKLTKVLNPWRLFRKKKKDVIEEMSESESTVEVEVKPKPPFRQHVQSYAMHGQEYYRPPPVPAPHCCGSPRHDCCHSYQPRARHQHPSSPDYYTHNPHHHDHAPAPHYNPKHPTSPYPNYDRHYNQIPQVPLCLKEIEVKSIGTQSERKVSILQKLAKKIPTAGTQQEQESSRYNAPAKEKPNFWKSLQEKAKQNDNDTMNFSMKMQKQLTQGDMNMKNAMMKKLFYKKNPFSPRNLIVRTLLGKDKSSYGNPPKMYRPRMFL